jgi:MoxR-like ATPase
VSRKIDGWPDLGLLEYADGSNKNVLISGPTGDGKSACVKAYSAASTDLSPNGKPLVILPCNGGIDPTTLFGMWVPDGKGGFKWVDSEFTMAVRYGGIIAFEEINMMVPRISAVFNTLTDSTRSLTVIEHNGEVIKAHPDLFIVGLYNPDYEGTIPLNAAFKDRFEVKLEFEYDTELEAKFVPAIEGAPVTALLEMATMLRNSHKVGTIETPISSRMLMTFAQVAFDCEMSFAVSNFLAAFPVEERGAVKKTVQVFSDKLQAELDAANKLYEEMTA